jgi:hypothetical protein
MSVLISHYKDFNHRLTQTLCIVQLLYEDKSFHMRKKNQSHILTRKSSYLLKKKKKKKMNQKKTRK